MEPLTKDAGSPQALDSALWRARRVHVSRSLPCHPSDFNRIYCARNLIEDRHSPLCYALNYSVVHKLLCGRPFWNWVADSFKPNDVPAGPLGCAIPAARESPIPLYRLHLTSNDSAIQSRDPVRIALNHVGEACALAIDTLLEAAREKPEPGRFRTV